MSPDDFPVRCRGGAPASVSGCEPEARVTVRIFFGGDEHERVCQVLEGVEGLSWFKGYVDARVPVEVVDRLVSDRVQVLVEDPAELANAAGSGWARPSKRTDPHLQARFQRLVGAWPESITAAPAYRFEMPSGLTEPRRDVLERNGVHILNFRGGAYQAYLTRAQLHTLEGLDFVHHLRPYDLLDSVSTDLLRELVRRDRAVACGEPVTETGVFEALPHMAEQSSVLARDLAGLSDRITQIVPGPSAIRFVMPFDDALIVRVASLLLVRQLTVHHDVGLASDRVRVLIGAEQVAQPMAVGNAMGGLTGAGEVIALLDSGIDPNHPDFGGPPGGAGSRLRAIRVRPGCASVDVIGHGTHVAGVAAGSGAASGGRVRGVAPGAELVVVSMAQDDGRGGLSLPEAELSELLRDAVADGATIVNCSWGRPLGSVYDGACASFDAYVHAHPDVLVVVAAGNQGQAASGERGFWSVGSPGTAKNVLTVGACGTDRDDHPLTWSGYDEVRFGLPAGGARLAPSTDRVALLSSAGPSDYGAVKPDLVAPGTYVLAPRVDSPDGFLRWEPHGEHAGRYMFMHGTSLAAPAVSGAAALLREHLRLRHGVVRPSAALLKALLISATRPLAACPRTGAPPIGYPDFDQGFGRLDLARILPFEGSPVAQRLLWVDVDNRAPEALQSGLPLGSPGHTLHRYRLEVTDRGVPLILTLAWIDAPGSGVQNDLQLGAVLADRRQLLGNEAHLFQRAFAPADPEGRRAMDRTNTVEQIRIDDPPLGPLVIRVWARNTVVPNQGYALVVCGPVSGAMERVD